MFEESTPSNVASVHDRSQLPLNDEFFDSGQQHSEHIAHLLQRDITLERYSKSLGFGEFGKWHLRKIEFPMREIYANRVESTFYVTDELAEMWDRRQHRAQPRGLDVETLQRWRSQPVHEHLQVWTITPKDEMREL